MGFSWAEAVDDTLYAASETGRDVWYIGYNGNMALEFIRDTAGPSLANLPAASEINEMVVNAAHVCKDGKQLQRDASFDLARFARHQEIEMCSSHAVWAPEECEHEQPDPVPRQIKRTAGVWLDAGGLIERGRTECTTTVLRRESCRVERRAAQESKE